MPRRGALGNAPGSDVHLTPPEIWDRLDRIGPGAWFDPCPHPHPEQWDGLNVPWEDFTYCNPPFSALDAWAQKAVRESRVVEPVVVLVPVRSSQPYFGRLLCAAGAVALWRGTVDAGGDLSRRVRFHDAQGVRQAGAPFDTALFCLTSSAGVARSFMAAFHDVATVFRPMEAL